METEHAQWPPRTIRESIPFVDLLALCLICFISPPAMMLQREQAIKSSLILSLGMLSWTAILFYRQYFWPKQRVVSKALLGLFTGSIMLAVMFSLNHSSAFFGNPNDRFGAGFLLSSIGIGLVLRKLDRRVLFASIYIAAIVLAIISIPYNLLFFGYLVRLAGPLRQPDILAVWLGCGFLIGLFEFVWFSKLTKVLLLSQAFLIVTILLTGTRAIVGLVPLLALLHVMQTQKPRKLVVGATVAAGCLFILFLPFVHARFNRVNDAQLLGQDAVLRLHVQSAAMKSLRHMPFWGYGPGDIENALACPKLTTPDLIRVCKLHLAFTSSHNIFIDRLLEFGWLGGLALLLLTVYAIHWGFRSGEMCGYAASYCLLLVALYYLTNITTTEVDALFWVLLVSALFAGVPAKVRHSGLEYGTASNIDVRHGA